MEEERHTGNTTAVGGGSAGIEVSFLYFYLERTIGGAQLVNCYVSLPGEMDFGYRMEFPSLWIMERLMLCAYFEEYR